MRCFKEVIGYRMWFIWLVEDIEWDTSIFPTEINIPQPIIGSRVTKKIARCKKGKDEFG